MPFLGGLINKVANTYRELRDTFTTTFRGREVQNETDQHESPRSVNFTITSDTAGAHAMARAALTVWLDQGVTDAMYDQIGRSGTEIVKQLLEPLRRSGSVQDSWKFRIDKGQNAVIIYSDHPASYAIQTGIRQAGSTQSLENWLRYKAEYSSLTDAQRKRLAFNIRRRIERGDSPGPNSDLSRLSPSGERRFDYISQATDQLTSAINGLLEGAVSGIR